MSYSANTIMLVMMYLLGITVITGAAATGLAADDPANATVAWDAENRVYTQGANESVLDITNPDRMANTTNDTNTSDQQGQGFALDEENRDKMDRALGRIPGLDTAENVTIRAYLATGQSLLDGTLSIAAPIGDRAASWAYENQHWLTEDHIVAFRLTAFFGPFGIYAYRRLQRARGRAA